MNHIGNASRSPGRSCSNRIAKATPEQIKANSARRYAKWIQKTKNDPTLKAKFSAARSRNYRLKKKDTTSILHKVGAGDTDISKWPLVTQPTSWYTLDKRRLLLKYVPNYFSAAQNDSVVKAIVDMIPYVPGEGQGNGVKGRHGEHGRAVTMAVWYELRKPFRGLLGSAGSVPKTIKARAAYAAYLNALVKASIFRRVNALVRDMVGKQVYEQACKLVKWATDCGTADHLKRWGKRPHSALTTVIDSPTLPHKDEKDYGAIPAVCTRFGSPGKLDDEFILPEYGIRIAYNPGDAIIGYMKEITHQVNISSAEGSRYTLVHYFREDIVTEAKLQGLPLSDDF